MSIEDRIARLERCLLALTASISGEAQAEGLNDPNGFAAMQQLWADDIGEMVRGLKS